MKNSGSYPSLSSKPKIPLKGKAPIVPPKGLPMEATYIVGQHADTVIPRAANAQAHWAQQRVFHQ